ncbi:hypothetical protein CBS9595_002821 [Malassezia furfur]|nr:hypothetical protein CBS9595_002821 [Malassezia furfur]
MRSIAYKFPKDGWQTILLLALFLYVDQADVGTIGARIRRAVGGPRTLDVLRKLVVAVHLGEALGMLAVNVRRGATLGVAIKWVATTFVLGYPSWITFGRLNNGIW